METIEINLHDDAFDCLPGYRLDRLELLNWGTFQSDGQSFAPRGAWSLLIGDNGSGKSTAIDALRTLLVPPRHLNYNDASGDGRKTTSRDRTRRSYIRGAWASSSTIDSTAPTTQYLREPGTLSAIAAVFADMLNNEVVTLAQVLWEYDEQVREIFAISRSRKSLKDLLGQHTNTTEIRRSAKQTGWELFDSFSSYSERMRKLLHIPGEKALEVFNRAIGMKEVGDIDAFVRQFLLPSADTFVFIRDTVQPHYRTLMDCWTAIDRAERQLSALRPVSENAQRVSAGETQIREWRALQDAIKPYFLTKYLVFLDEHMKALEQEHVMVQAKRDSVISTLEQRRRDRDDLIVAISSSDAGLRLQVIDRDIKLTEGERQRATDLYSRLRPSIAILDAEKALLDEASFMSARPLWESTETLENQNATDSEDRRSEHRHRQSLALSKANDVREELASVEQNKVNIPRRFLAVRSRLCEALRVDSIEMPFAGELIEVKQEYLEWAGAIERLLSGFGLSLLVPERLYRPAAEFINSTPLDLKLTFYSVPDRVPTPPHLSSDLVPGRLSFRVDHPLHSWVIGDLARRFNHRCCMTIAELEKSERGLTREGLTRDRSRHVKDDSRPLNDPKDRILGWSTERKIAALRAQITDLEKQATEEGKKTTEAINAALLAKSRANAARGLLNVSKFLDIHPEHWSEQLIRLKADKESLESSSKELQLLQQQKTQAEADIHKSESELRLVDGEASVNENNIAVCGRRRIHRREQLQEFADYQHDTIEEEFVRLVGQHATITFDNPDQLIQSSSQSIQGRINNETGKVNDAAEKMMGAMSDFLKEFPEFSQTLLAGRAYAASFLAAQRRIEDEDLPVHRDNFERYLNENLVGDLLMLDKRLEEHSDTIVSRVQEVNQALKGIEYRDDTYVQLRLVNQPNVQVSDFRRLLKDCFEHGISPAPEERLRVFARVRTLLEKFQAEPDTTQRVTDVRTWYSTGVRELRRQDDSEADFFAATTGKSGGQKAKLAFTILASALTAQYGLSHEQPESSNFRLVVIDEAFSRTDEQNSQRAMQLFKDLGFQVVIVGPFDAKAKLAVPFVKTIHLASNPSGNKSQMYAITREKLESDDLEVLELTEASTPPDGSIVNA